eukprot:TRINITY_DN34886_c0_g2_i2.p1 TRINITY_DN34886_c0_g2~~TRINITY_DN34886_c0_g2_i2.p1  ORF type:complete len:523 (+),score=83.70 TRINITY_DN34886_c0_g2_i2:50-1570(+)
MSASGGSSAPVVGDGHGGKGRGGYGSHNAAAVAVPLVSDGDSAAKIRRYRLSDPRALPPLRDGPPAPLWDVQSTEDVGALLSGCSGDSVICCGFSAPYADGMKAQATALQELAAAVPAGFVFATVDIRAFPEVASWAGVSCPMVRIYEPDGSVVAEVRSTDIASGALHQAVLSQAAVIAKAAQPKLEALALKYPKTFHTEVMAIPVGADCEKMRQQGLDVLQRFGASAADVDAFTALCSCCGVGSTRTPRVREVASLAKSLRQLPVGDVLPLLDLARRLAARKALGGGEPGAWEALELLLDAALCRGLEEKSVDLTRASIAVQFASNCFLVEALREAVLPVVGQLVSTDAWLATWVSPEGDRQSPGVRRSRDAATALLLNASIALRSARCRAEHAGLLQATTLALHAMPDNERLNLAAGNILAVGGGAEEAKRVLQTQPLQPLRSFAAAVFRGDLEDEESRAFPEVWRPEQPPHGGGDGGGGAGTGDRRPPRGRVPARARRRLGGG